MNVLKRWLDWVSDPDVSPYVGARRTALSLGGAMALIEAAIIIVAVWTS